MLVRKVIALVASVAVLGVVVVSALQVGSPGRARQERFDEQRVQHLQQLQYAVENFWQREKRMPASLTDVQPWGPIVKDPETGAAYEYRLVDAGKRSYELCATFAFAVETAVPVYRYSYPEQSANMYQHGAGRQCFTLTAPELYPVR